MMELCKNLFVHVKIVLLVTALCLAQSDISTPSAYSTDEIKSEKSLTTIQEQNESVTQSTNAALQSDSYTPSDIFPSDETKYNITTNETLIQQLLKLHENSSEVDDLVHGGDFSKVHLTSEAYNSNDNETVNSNYDSQELDEENEDVEIPKSEMEWIEDGRDNEDEPVPIEIINETVKSSTVHYTVKSDYVGIFAGFFIISGVLLYLGVTAWRRMLRQRYGQREMLINEEEFYDPSDMKHFSI